METTLFKVSFNDGRVFKIFCQNRNQKDRFIKSWNTVKDISQCEVLENGIHKVKQWEKIISTIK